MARLGRNGFIAIAVVFHLMYIFSIFDIYFVSPVVSGMRPFRADTETAPAKRLVLFVGDGLRADKAFQSFPDPSPNAPNNTDSLRPRPLAPFLRSRVLNHGTFGVSHTRVPTESRPGHVALIAGLYEDVSAVTTGWKLNPVNFDSVFNRSRHTWSWGSPDILPMFQMGGVPGRIDADCYEAHDEDFSQSALWLDTWVFDKVKTMFQDAEKNKTLNEELRKDKNVFFLHLLGLDTTGHGKRPYSKEYLHNIQVVDQGVEETTNLINNFYGDDQTAFVFTADHGMSDWGSHGDGHPDNTRTPLIAWGAGVAKPVKTSKGLIAPGHEDGFSSDWGLDQVKRHDVAQADIAALMAYLAGLEFPVNSVGELPLSFLDTDAKTKAKAMLANAQGVLEMYHVKEEQKKARELRYVQYGPLAEEGKSADQRVAGIKQRIGEEKYEDAIAESLELIQLALGGLRYLQTYDWLFLRTLVTIGYLGWIAFAITTCIDLHVLDGKIETSRTTASLIAFSSVFVALCGVLYVQNSSWTYYAYGIFPVVFWEEVYARKGALSQGSKVLFGHVNSSLGFFSLALKTVAFLGLLEALVQSYFTREIYTVCYLAAIAWPALYGKDFVKQNRLLVVTWTLACTAMSLFTLLPVIKTESVSLILVGGGLMLVMGLLYLAFEKSILSESTKSKEGLASQSLDWVSRSILGIQLGLVVLSMVATYSSVTALQTGQKLPLGAQVLGWIVLLASMGMPFVHGLRPNNHYLHRLVVIFLTFAPSFVILTISYEGLFYFFFCTTVLTWVRLEHHIYIFNQQSPTKQSKPIKGKSKANGNSSPLKKDLDTLLNSKAHRAITLADTRISLFFLFLLQSAFFSTGNIASVSSFSLEAVMRLIPVFDPFSQGALLLLKIMIPFAVISANLGILNRRLGIAPSALFMLVMAMTDVMTLNFFYMVKDEGSWLDIGTTISHFCIASMLCVFVAGLEWVSEAFVRGVEVGEGVGDAGVKGIDTGNKNETPNGKTKKVNGRA